MPKSLPVFEIVFFLVVVGLALLCLWLFSMELVNIFIRYEIINSEAVNVDYINSWLVSKLLADMSGHWRFMWILNALVAGGLMGLIIYFGFAVLNIDRFVAPILMTGSLGILVGMLISPVELDGFITALLIGVFFGLGLGIEDTVKPTKDTNQ